MWRLRFREIIVSIIKTPSSNVLSRDELKWNEEFHQKQLHSIFFKRCDLRKDHPITHVS